MVVFVESGGRNQTIANSDFGDRFRCMGLRFGGTVCSPKVVQPLVPSVAFPDIHIFYTTRKVVIAIRSYSINIGDI
jgi:hypothetical protein